MATFYLIRHGQKEAVPFDPPLTKIGVKQAKITSEVLKDIGFKEIIAKPHLLSINTDIRLIERLEWENDESFDEFIAEWNKTDIDRSYLPKKGMSSKANGEQMKTFLEEVSNKHSEGDILIVTHGGTIGDLLRTLFTEEVIDHKTEPSSGARYIDILECSMTTIKKSGDKYALLKLGDISHLSIPLI